MVDVDALQKELEQCKTQSASYFEGWQRERADFSNYRRRVEGEKAQTYQNAAGNIFKKFLVIADDLARALKNRPTEGEAAAWSEGIELIYRKLLSQMEAEGVHRMNVDGQFFNPDMEEAISHEDSPDHESGQIIEVVQDGYMLGDRVLRPALVRVAR
jgi:molecular chaperone GrpE